MKNQQYKELLIQHNEKVKPAYQCDNLESFKAWVADKGHEDYIEISGLETLSGHAEILDF